MGSVKDKIPIMTRLTVVMAYIGIKNVGLLSVIAVTSTVVLADAMLYVVYGSYAPVAS